MIVTIGHRESTSLIILENISEVFYQRNYIKIYRGFTLTEPAESWVYPYRVLNSINVVHSDD